MNVDVAISGGIALVGILQVANHFRSGKLLDKMDKLVTKEDCKEKRENCSTVKSMKYLKHQIGNHEHNGDGVKFLPMQGDNN